MTANKFAVSRFLPELKLRGYHAPAADLVFQLAKNNVPAVMGFRWDIEDDKALEFTKSFYEHLFNDDRSLDSLEYAFLEARQEMHSEYESNRIWASPMLVMQR